MYRDHNEIPLSLTNAGTSTVIDLRNLAGGELYVSGSQAALTGLTWYASRNGEDWLPAYDADGAAVETAVDGTNGGAYPIPAALFAVAFAQARANAAGPYAGHCGRKS